MKIVYLVALWLILSGCATSVPKEQLREIFILLKDKKFDAAEKKFDATTSGSLIGQYSTYSGQTIPAVNSPNHDDVSSLISGAKSYIEDCQEKVVQVQKLSPLKPNTDESNFHENFKNIQEDFANNCRSSVQEKWSPISKIKEYSTVDLFPIIQTSDLEFRKQVNRINAELTQIERKSSQKRTDEKAKQDLYEASPEYYSKKLCEMDDRVKLGKTIISRENEAGNVSGYVDKKKLHEAGKVIQINQDLITRFSEEYKTKFGKSWDSAECK